MSNRPQTGINAWKALNITTEERIDYFLDMIEHAVEVGIPLRDLYRRHWLKEFILFTVQLSTHFRESHMTTLTLTSTFASTITVGDPGVLTFNLAPRETKSLNVTEAQARELIPGLEKLKQAGWISYVVTQAEDKPPAPVPVPASAPAPAPIKEAPPLETVPAETKLVTNAFFEAPPETKPEAVEEKPVETASNKNTFFDRKHRHK